MFGGPWSLVLGGGKEKNLYPCDESNTGVLTPSTINFPTELYQLMLRLRIAKTETGSF
jgi:hypothetical protein